MSAQTDLILPGRRASLQGSESSHTRSGLDESWAEIGRWSPETLEPDMSMTAEAEKGTPSWFATELRGMASEWIVARTRVVAVLVVRCRRRRRKSERLRQARWCSRRTSICDTNGPEKSTTVAETTVSSEESMVVTGERMTAEEK